MRLPRIFTVGVAIAAVALVGTTPAQAGDLPESNAVALEILHDYYPGYWWDHTDLTVAVQASPQVKSEYRAAVRGAIGDWSSVLHDQFGDVITLTDITDRTISKQKADIVLHYVPAAGGVVFSGFAQCGEHRCPNILVSTDFAGQTVIAPDFLGQITMHELGHALGIGHATNLLESTDLMGYGWPDLGEPTLSRCDIDALRYVFGWAFEGSDPYPPPTMGPYDCSLG